MNSKNQEKKDIEVISGTGQNLEISPVQSYVPISKPKTNKKSNKKIIIPGEKKNL